MNDFSRAQSKYVFVACWLTASAGSFFDFHECLGFKGIFKLAVGWQFQKKWNDQMIWGPFDFLALSFVVPTRCPTCWYEKGGVKCNHFWCQVDGFHVVLRLGGMSVMTRESDGKGTWITYIWSTRKCAGPKFHKLTINRLYITYLPHKAVAEVSKNKEPIGRECAEFNWFESQLMSDSNELRVKWFGCHLIWDSNDFGCQLIWDSIDLVVNWFEIQMIWLSIDLRFKWFGCQSVCASNDFGCLLIWTSSDVVVNWFEIQLIWLSTDLRFKWVGCQLIWDSNDLDVKWFEVQVIWLSADEWFKWFCQTKLFCETSFKLEALKLKNEAFLRDVLQNWSFEAQKRSFCARLPSKMKLWRSKTKQFCETSFKNEALKLKNEAFVRDFFENEALKLKNEAFVRDFLQKGIFEDQKRSFCARLPLKKTSWRDTWPQNSNMF